jgi:hypothetical protein
MFDLALKAKIPIIGVQTDDLLNVRAILQSIAQRPLLPLPTARSQVLVDSYLYWTDDIETVTVDNYRKLAEAGAQAVVINPSKQSSLIFDAGELPTPEVFLRDYLSSFVSSEDLTPLVNMLRGLSLKSAGEVVQLTMARTGSVLPADIRRTRMMMNAAIPGLTTLETDYDFYVMPHELQAWLDLNDKYFLNENTPLKLMPRGVLLSGHPGVGKSLAARVIAKHWNVPLFRLDIATSLNRYLGESETRITHALAMIERQAPCVLLFDEVEKLFGNENEEGTTTRILSLILWWLQEHRSKIVTIMTTNNLKAIPRELYRPGRIDQVIKIAMLTIPEAKLFALRVYESVLGTKPGLDHQKAMREAIEALHRVRLSHSATAEIVYKLIKAKSWIELDILKELMLTN